MTESVRTLAFPLVNAYLVRGGEGFVLIDTGVASNRRRLEAALANAGCRPGDLQLIVLTHGDPDHTGNAAYLRARYGAKIAMHERETPAVEHGDMFLSRGRMSLPRKPLKPIMGLFRLRKRDRFSPDLHVDNGDRLTEYGLDATVLHVPGHTTGSIAVLTDDGALFSGDFLENRRRPSLATLVDDAVALRASFERVKKLAVRIVYPGHGKAFTMEAIATGDGRRRARRLAVEP